MKSNRKEVAHLMRRAAFGATAEELDELTSTFSYDEIVDFLVKPEHYPDIDQSYIDRYYFGETSQGNTPFIAAWVYRMLNGHRPLQEKMTLFLHHIFPVGWGKGMNFLTTNTNVATYRRIAMTNFKNILLELSKDPAMLYWLDNNENHKGEINENYGRELLELFSMGVGNYTEDDIKNASRAFTGWTFNQPISLYPWGYYPAKFEFHPADHDNDKKVFLGREGNFNGEDIIEIIVEQEATARFVSRHLCNFFVEDEPQVPAWNIEPPRDPALVDQLSKVFMETSGDMPAVLQELFKSDGFKNSINLPKVKSPTELIVGVLKQVGTYSQMKPGLEQIINTLSVMGQELLNPPTVEGWHTGSEWIDSGTLSERINFASRAFADMEAPGVRDIVQRVGSLEGNPDDLLEKCLDVLGGIEVSSATNSELLEYATGLIEQEKVERGSADISDLIQMIVSTVDYQYA